jgi:hypothetical protein
MNAEPKIEQATQEQPKSKRLSSLIWILVLWGGVRACSEMDGISWERAFWVAASSWGAIPASMLLCCALIFPLGQQKTLRWAALGAVILGFGGTLILGGYFEEDTTPTETNYFFIRQLIYPIVVIGWVALKHSREKKK